MKKLLLTTILFLHLPILFLNSLNLNLNNALFAQTVPSLEEVKGLMPGDTVSNFIAKDADGNVFDLNKALSEGPVVVIFYRGQWCPYCNKHLKNLQDSLNLLQEKGARVIAISPEKPEYLNTMENKTGAQFTLLYDSAYLISEQFEVLFDPGKKLINRYGKIAKEDLSEVHGSEKALLPVPATFIINQEGIILWRHFDPNYKSRSDVQSILANLP